MFGVVLIVLVAFLTTAVAFRQHMGGDSVRYQLLRSRLSTQLFSEPKPTFPEQQMTVDELKSELELRSVDYDDCISKNELVERLVTSRTTGKADKEILSKFNEFSTTEGDMPPGALDDDMINQVKAKDGTLPGGLPPEMMKALSADPEIMTMLRDKKMQDIMAAVMEGGPDGMKKYLSDPDAMLLIEKLGKAISRATNGQK